MTGTRNTLASDLVRAAAIGRDEGVRYVYAGNLPGEVGGLEDTRCPSCGATVIARRGYQVSRRAQDAEGRCLACKTPIAGYWGA
jgi:pyruvate formate lyase activating enzyme